MLGAGYTLLKKNMYAPTSSTIGGPYGGRGLLTPPYTRSSSSREWSSSLSVDGTWPTIPIPSGKKWGRSPSV